MDSNTNKHTKLCVFQGTFNPIHNGHLMIANYVLNNANVDKVLFIASPEAPFKDTHNVLLDFKIRCDLIELSKKKNYYENKYCCKSYCCKFCSFI